MSQKIEDYGEKIGGAKKDLWKQRGLMVSDFKKMNDRESEKYVTKDNIWQKPDYMQLVQDGLDIKVAYFRKLVRDALPRKPVFSYYAITEEEKRAVVVRYIEFVRALKEAVSEALGVTTTKLFSETRLITEEQRSLLPEFSELLHNLKYKTILTEDRVLSEQKKEKDSISFPRQKTDYSSYNQLSLEDVFGSDFVVGKNKII